MPSLRRTAVVFSLVALCSPVVAHGLGIEKGVKLGANLANFRGEFADAANTKGKLGFVGGPFVAFEFAPHLAVQAEALISMKGAKTTTIDVNDAGIEVGSFTSTINVNYLEVPVLLRGTLLSTPRIRPMIYLGPALGFSVGGTVHDPAPGFGDQKLTDLRPVDVGAAFGIGVGAGMGHRRFLADLRYTTGFSDIYDISGNLASINSVFSLMVGIGF
jgi:hypothetical protein